MAKYRLMTMVNAKPGREAEMNDWYDGQHVPDLLSVAGVTVGQRFRVRNPMVPAEPLFQYVNIFEIEADDPMAVMAEVFERTASGKFLLSDAFDLVSMAVYEAVAGHG